MSVIVIGAGWYGIAAAKAYLELEPAVELTLLDECSSVGGVWSASRIYPGLIADSPAALFEFSDLHLWKEGDIGQWSDIPGHKVHQYLEAYARKYGLLQRCRLNTKVTKIRKHNAGWQVHTQPVNETRAIESFLYCDKLIVATGITSRPNLPELPMDKFAGTTLHSQELGQRHALLTSKDIRSVIVVGANKSSVEAVSICVSAGKKVFWLIRKDGRGPGALRSTRNENGVHQAAVSTTRWASLFNPGLYSNQSWLHRFLYSEQSRLGSWVCERYWRSVNMVMLAKKASIQGQRRLLNPDTIDSFWPIGVSSFMHDNEKRLMEMVDEGESISVVREDLVSATDDKVCLSDGRIIQAQAIVFATGWTLSHNVLFDDETAVELGLPPSSGIQEPSEAAYWERLHSKGCELVFKMYPKLRKPPREARCQGQQAFRLFRTIAPPKLAAIGSNSIAFLGLLSNNQVSNHAEVSGLWAAAYLTGLLYGAPVGNMLVDKLAMDHDVATMNAFMERRYLGRKGRVPDAATDIQDYVDLMMRDMGLRVDRKRWILEKEKSRSWFGLKAWWMEWFSPYLPEDYCGVADEFLSSMDFANDKAMLRRLAK